MIKRDFLKLLGAGLASIPFAGKLFREGLPEIKVAAKGIARTLPKVKGMPEWFTPLVNKIMKEGKDISPKASRLEDLEIVKKLEVPTAKGESEIITLTQNKATGEISIESKTGGVGDSPFEVVYKPPKSDINLETGKQIKDPGDFYVLENRPKPEPNNPGKVEFDYDIFHIDEAHSEIEKLEKIATGKIKDLEKAEQRLINKQRTETHPYEDISNRFPEPDYARGGIVNFSTGGYPPVEEDNQFGQNIQTIPTGFYFGMNPPVLPTPQPDQEPVSGNLRDFRSMMSNINPQLGYTGVDYGANVSAMMNPYINAPKSYSANAYYGPEQDRYRFGITTIPTIGSKQIMGGYEGPYGNISLGASKDPMGRNFMVNYTHNFADGGQVKTHLTRTIPPVRGPMSQGVETLFKRRYR